MQLEAIIELYRAVPSSDNTVLKLLTKISSLDAKRSTNVFQLMEKASELERRLRGLGKDANEIVLTWLNAYRAELDPIFAKQKDIFGDELAYRLQAHGLKLEGQYPKLNAGLLAYELKFERGRCVIWYGPQLERLVEVNLDAAKVTDATTKCMKQLGSGLDADTLVNILRQATLCAQLNRPTTSVPITAVLPFQALLVQPAKFRADPRKELYHGYGRADFSYDLYRLSHARHPFRLEIATLSVTHKPNNTLWVPTRINVEGGRYFSTITIAGE